METNGISIVKVGTKVCYRGSWGKGEYATASVIDIEECENGEKYGTPVDSTPIEKVEDCVFTLDDGHWCYGWQIYEIIGEVAEEEV